MNEIVHTPPEGFELDPNRQLYYRYVHDDNGAELVVWFDPVTGEFELVNYHDEQCPGQEKIMFAYDPPKDFEFDPDSLRYVRTELDENGTLWIVKFNAITGEFEELSFPNALSEPEPEPSPPIAEPEQESSPPLTEPEPEPSPPPTVSEIDAPDGFELDQASGLYYKAMPGKNPATGEIGQWYTWFYPESGEFQQQFHSDY